MLAKVIKDVVFQPPVSNVDKNISRILTIRNISRILTIKKYQQNIDHKKYQQNIIKRFITYQMVCLKHSVNHLKNQVDLKISKRGYGSFGDVEIVGPVSTTKKVFGAQR